MSSISFFNPIVFTQGNFYIPKTNKSFLESLTEKVDSYCDFIQQKWTSIYLSEGRGHGCYAITLPQHSQSSLICRIIKWISYTLIIPIIFALLLKFLLRMIVLSKYGPFSFPVLRANRPIYAPKGIGGIHKEVYRLLKRYDSPGKIPQEEQEKLGIKILLDQKYFSFMDQSGFIFTSIPVRKAALNYLKTLWAGEIVQNNGYYQLCIPNCCYIYAPANNLKGEACHLIVKESGRTKKKVDSSIEDIGNIYSKTGNEGLKCLKQLFQFVVKSGWDSDCVWNGNIKVTSSSFALSYDRFSLVLQDLSMVPLPGDPIPSPGVLIEKWLKGWCKMQPGSIHQDVLEALGKEMYCLSPTSLTLSLLKEAATRHTLPFDETIFVNETKD